MVKQLAKHGTDLCNAFPCQDGVSKDTSPTTIVYGKGKLDFNILKLEFRAYCLVAEDGDNTMRGRMFGAIALTYTGKSDGSYTLMFFKTG